MPSASTGLIDSNTTYMISGLAGLGGGVYVTGTFNMYGGTVSNNVTGQNGGGVAVNSGMFTFSNGTISGNSSTYVYNPSTYEGR